MRSSKYTREVLAPVVASSRSLAQVMRKLGLKPTGGNYRYINARIRVAGVDTSHFRGRGWSRGETLETHPSLERASRKMRLPDELVFVENSRYTKNRVIARRLVAMGVPSSCAICGLVEWRQKPLVLHVDHINGINNDNRLENLRFLCPNCHSQTATYCRRPSRVAECDGLYWIASRSCEAAHVLYEVRSRAWRNWYPHYL